VNETTTSAANAKIARQMTDTFGLPNYEMPKMEMSAASRGAPRLMIYTALGHRSSQCAHTSSDEKSNFATIAIKHQIRMRGWLYMTSRSQRLKYLADKIITSSTPSRLGRSDMVSSSML
jgi:hypothetical protein